jgi:AcrR family transcriptional regulator
MTIAGASSRSAAETKARIVSVAQHLFATKGYSHAGLREIARMAEVAPSLLVKHFGSKAQLFEAALIASIFPIGEFQADRSKFGEAIVNAIIDRGFEIFAPAMIGLSLGDTQSREIAARVVREQIIEPIAQWLDEDGHLDQTIARSVSVFMITTGYALCTRNMDLELDADSRARTNRHISAALQALVEAPSA